MSDIKAEPTDRSPAEAGTGWHTVHRIIFPASDDTALLPLYVEAGAAHPVTEPRRTTKAARQLAGLLRSTVRAELANASTTPIAHGRYDATIPPHSRISMATYFNAFPASYWREYTDVERVRLDIKLDGIARIDIVRSGARGNYLRVDGARRAAQEASFIIDLNRFGDGGWLWFDIETSDEPARLLSAEWSAERAEPPRTRTNIAITTFNLAQACIDQANRLADHPTVLERVHRVVIVDQGTSKVVDHPQYAATATRLGEQLEVIEQPNLGGSGGFSRGMLEALDGSADYVLLLDDDAEAEPESILRAMAIADFARNPTIIGGHMFNLNEPTILHSFGEHIYRRTFWWEPTEPELSRVDFSQQHIRTSLPLNRRIDVEYNGWWMCLIPTGVVKSIGLSMPFFIKWDDAEYGLRAGAAGIRTVSMPGVAAWHVPWDEKDDGLDWQAYFHQRNRWVTALLHSHERRGGSLGRTSLASDIKHLLSMQYTAAILRATALEDVLAGPQHLGRSLADTAQQVRAAAHERTDGQLIQRRRDFPQVDRIAVASVPPPSNVLEFAARALRSFMWQARSVRGSEVQARVPSAAVNWWTLGRLDVALVSNASGSGAWIYRRNRRLFWQTLLRVARSYRALRRGWPELARAYRDALPDLVSAESWAVRTSEETSR